MMRRARIAWFVRVGLMTALSLGLPGTPRPAAAAAGMMGPCQQECDGSAGDSGCPPTCTDGVCANIVAAVIEAVPDCGAISPPSRGCLCDGAEPLAPPPGDGVFHPPIC